MDRQRSVNQIVPGRVAGPSLERRTPRQRLGRWMAFSASAALVLAGLVSVGWTQAGPERPATTPASLPADSKILPPAQGDQAKRPQSTTRYADAPPNARVTEEGWFAPIKPQISPPALPASIERAFVIPIHGEMNETMARSLARKVQYCRGKGARLVVFDMDTPGGYLGATENMVRMLTQDLRDIYTVAFVNPDAFSAGAILSLACHEIVMTPTSRIGAARPIMATPGGGLAQVDPEIQGKFESAARSVVRSLAEANGYDPLICEGMVGSKIVIWLIRHQQTRQLKFVKAEEWSSLLPPSATTQPAERKPLPEPGWEYVRTIDGPLEFISATAQEAVFLGLARRIVPDKQALWKTFGVQGEPEVLLDTWSEELVDFLTSPVVTSILVLLLIGGVYMEFQAPGLGLPGLVALIALALLLGSRYLIGLAVWWEVALLIAGLILILLEIFVTPGFGVLGITGIVTCVVALIGVVVANAPDRLPIPDTDLSWQTFRYGLLAVLVGLVGAIFVAYAVARYMPKMPVTSRLMLKAPTLTPEAPVESDSPFRHVQVGDVGVVTSVCRPIGQVRIGEQLIDAQTEGEYLQPGTAVRVTRKEGNRIVIDRIQNA